MKTVLLAAIFVAMLRVTHAAEETPISDAEARDRMQQIAEQIQWQRRLLREMRGEGLPSAEELAKRAQDHSGREIVCPAHRWVTGTDKPVSIVMTGVPIWYAARFYAFLTQKEVTVSSSVASASISIRAESISRADAISRFEAEFTRMGVVIQPAGDSKLALVGEAEANKPVETTSLARPEIWESCSFSAALRSVSHG